MQPLNTDLLQNELSYWSMNIIYASIDYPIRYVPNAESGDQLGIRAAVVAFSRLVE